MVDVIRIGIIGLGGIGVYHAERLPNDALVGGVDISPDARAYFRDQFGQPAYSDPEALYDRADAVIICTPNRYHEPYATDALQRDIHVLLEKPLAHSVASAERIAGVAAQSDAVCMVGFNNRFATSVIDTRRAIDDGRLGHVTHVETNYVRQMGAPDGWFTNPEVSGGGVLIDLGVHALDLGLYLLGHPDVGGVVGAAHNVHDTPVDDMAHATLETADGRTLSCNTAWGAPYDSTTVVVHGTEDARTFEFFDSAVDTHATEQSAFIEAIHCGAAGNVEQALSVQRVVDEIYAGGTSTRAFYGQEQLYTDGGDDGR